MRKMKKNIENDEKKLAIDYNYRLLFDKTLLG